MNKEDAEKFRRTRKPHLPPGAPGSKLEELLRSRNAQLSMEQGAKLRSRRAAMDETIRSSKAKLARATASKSFVHGAAKSVLGKVGGVLGAMLIPDEISADSDRVPKKMTSRSMKNVTPRTHPAQTKKPKK